MIAIPTAAACPQEKNLCNSGDVLHYNIEVPLEWSLRAGF